MAHGAHTRRHLSPASLARDQKGFLRSLKRRRPETRGTYERALREFLRWAGRRGGTDFTLQEIVQYKRYLAAGRKLSPVSVSTYLTALRRFGEYLAHRGTIARNAALEVRGNSRPRLHTRAFLSPEQVGALLASVGRGDERGKRDFAFMKLMLGCALSEIEIIRANIGDLTRNEEGAFLAVQGKGRTKKDQTVRVPEDVCGSLEDYLLARPASGSAEPLFTSAGNRTRGKRMTTRGVRDRVMLYLRRTGIEVADGRHVTPYSLRHTAARFLAGTGASADAIREHLRLGSLATARLYLPRSEDQRTG
jgi:site-specific recombinase XerD